LIGIVNDDFGSSAADGDKVRDGDSADVTSATASSSSDSAVTVVALSPLSELVSDVKLSDTDDVAELVSARFVFGPSEESLYLMDTMVACVPVAKCGCRVSLYTSLRSFHTPSGLLNSVSLNSGFEGGYGGNRGVRLGDMEGRGGGAYGVEAVNA
jgi:hypothetical protein